eukprot:scaffold11009_cov103-Isochrysis_galbana.AAC.2
MGKRQRQRGRLVGAHHALEPELGGEAARMADVELDRLVRRPEQAVHGLGAGRRLAGASVEAAVRDDARHGRVAGVGHRDVSKPRAHHQRHGHQRQQAERQDVLPPAVHGDARAPPHRVRERAVLLALRKQERALHLCCLPGRLHRRTPRAERGGNREPPSASAVDRPLDQRPCTTCAVSHNSGCALSLEQRSAIFRQRAFPASCAMGKHPPHARRRTLANLKRQSIATKATRQTLSRSPDHLDRRTDSHIFTLPS